ncbi:SRPBCC domain-containing protein [Aquimarina sp. 2201CG5-10]|uniref:SRPBCC family protein n=1 Tax=Aquimarina callyspongiae TaxID=3098150 RepID=UPI002AB52AB9|nr:SRPBCC domain-containing protein [Aquimarina sp. 2201CG5-10]MDY8137917.1 SRPBCC domain-containing protein [Aquimarina sp. 2201CG5-10]
MTQDNNSVIVEQSFDASAEEVWNALTDITQMRQWFFDNIPSFEPVVGFETQFTVNSGNRDFLHQWKITEVEHNKKIVYDWSYKEYEGKAFVVFELFDKKDHTLLRVTNIGLETFTADIPEFSRESCQGGWEYFIQQNLKRFLDKN